MSCRKTLNITKLKELLIYLLALETIEFAFDETMLTIDNSVTHDSYLKVRLRDASVT